MNCDDTRHLISRYLDNQLSDAEWERVEEHLQSCGDCSEYYSHVQELQKAADDLEIGGDENYWTRQKDSIIERISEIEPTGITPVPSRYSRSALYKLAAVAAAIALVAFVSIFESKYIKPTQSIFEKKKTAFQSMSPDTSSKPPFAKPDGESTMRERGPEAPSGLEETEQPEMPGKAIMEHVAEGLYEEIPAKEKEVAEPLTPLLVKKEEKGGIGVPQPVAEQIIEAEAMADEVPTETGQPDHVEKVEGYDKMVGTPEAKTGAVDQQRAIAPEGEFANVKVAEISSRDEFHTVAAEPYSYKRSLTANEDKDITLKLDAGAKSFIANRAERDPIIFAELTPEERQAYDEWYNNVDSLQVRYGYLLSPHRIEMAAKRRDSIPTDSLNPVIMEMAEAFYNLGRLTPIKEERGIMLANLRRLSKEADSMSGRKIDSLVSELETIIK